MAYASSRKPVYAVISFSKAKNGVAIDGPRPATGEASARRLAERLAAQRLGAIAIYRVGDPDIGEFDEPVEVARFGIVPAECEMALLGF